MSWSLISKRLIYYKNILSDHCLIFLSVMLVVLLGCVFQYGVHDGEMSGRFLSHMYKVCGGLCMVCIMFFVDVKTLRHMSYIMWLFSFLALVFVHFFGVSVMGAQRWINLGFVRFQPSEVMKVAAILSLSQYYSVLHYEDVARFRSHIISVLFLVSPCILILLQPDLGTALLVLFSGMSVVYVSGIPKKYVHYVMCFVFCALPFCWNMLHEYQKKRFLIFLNPESDINGAGYHIYQSKISIGSGGFFGKGFLQGTQARLDFVPEKSTDFIFTTVCEAHGFVGAVCTILAVLVLVLFFWKMSGIIRDKFCKYACFGFGTLIFLHLFVNVAMVSGLAPVVGIPMPFISFGGTSLFSLMFCCGFLLSSLKTLYR